MTKTYSTGEAAKAIGVSQLFKCGLTMAWSPFRSFSESVEFQWDFGLRLTSRVRVCWREHHQVRGRRK